MADDHFISNIDEKTHDKTCYDQDERFHDEVNSGRLMPEKPWEYGDKQESDQQTNNQNIQLTEQNSFISKCVDVIILKLKSIGTHLHQEDKKIGNRPESSDRQNNGELPFVYDRPAWHYQSLQTH